MALTALQQLQNESALISQGKVKEAVASSQSYNAPVVAIPAATQAAPKAPDPFAIAPTGGYVNPSLAASTNAALPVAKQDKKISTRVPTVLPAGRLTTRNPAAEQKALTDILASSSIKDGTDVNTLSDATKQLLQENINIQVYGKANPVFQNAPAQTAPLANVPAPATSVAEPIAAPINRPILDSVLPTGVPQPVAGFLSEEPVEPRSLADIRLDTLAQAQAVIDATEAYFQASLDRISKVGEANLAQASSQAVGAGLAGSPFQSAIESNQVTATNQALNEVSSQRAGEVASLLANAESEAQNIYQQGIQNFQADRSFYASERDKQQAYTDNLIAEAKKLGNQTLLNIAAGGYSLDEMPAGEYQKLLDNTGMSDFEAKSIWAAHTPEANATYTTQNNHLVMTYFDPVTRKPVVTVTPLPPELVETEGVDFDIKSITLGDGSVILYDANNPYDENGKLKTITYAGEGIVRTYASSRSGGGGSGSGSGDGSSEPVLSKDEFVQEYIRIIGEERGVSPDINNPTIVAEIDTLYKKYLAENVPKNTSNYSGLLATLNATKGSDGYVNTDTYKEIRSQQKDKTGFDKNFSYLLNPNDRSARSFVPSNLTTSNIPPSVLKNLDEDILAGEDEANLYQTLVDAYPDVQASFIVSEMQRLGVY